MYFLFLSFMYRSKILNRIKLDYFLKFVVYELNAEMVKSRIVVLTGKEKADADGLQPECCALLLEHQWARGREKADVTCARVKYSQTTTETSLSG
jgi:hypothetical protein